MPYHPHFYSTTQTWPPLARYLSTTNTGDRATDSNAAEHGASDEDNHSDASDDSTETIGRQVEAMNLDSNVAHSYHSEASDDSAETIGKHVEVPDDTPTDEQYWSCIACWNVRNSPATAECHFCDETTVTIKRWNLNNKPVVVDEDGDDVTGEDVETPWICVDCGEAKLFLGGRTASDPIFRGYCAQCQTETDTVYADRRSSYCCRSCRYESHSGSHARNVRAGNEMISAYMWTKFCHRCDRVTDTIKLDPTSPKEWCCQHCRFARDPPEDEEDEEEDWCRFCQQTTDTVEIDSL